MKERLAGFRPGVEAPAHPYPTELNQHHSANTELALDELSDEPAKRLRITSSGR